MLHSIGETLLLALLFVICVVVLARQLYDSRRAGIDRSKPKGADGPRAKYFRTF
jgi:hypothetical protein